MLTQEQLKTKLIYSPDTGEFSWVDSCNVRAKLGKKPGSLTNHGYISIRLFGNSYLAHVLAWIYMKGSMPSSKLDHIDTNKTNNRWGNIRPATNAQNVQNTGLRAHNKSGFKGVSWYKSRSKWKAECQANGKRKHIGYFEKIEDAAFAYAKVAKELHGEFYHA